MIRIRATYSPNPEINFTALVDQGTIYDVDADFSILGTSEQFAEVAVNKTSDLSKLDFRLEVISLN
jgi:hypothetical protein